MRKPRRLFKTSCVPWVALLIGFAGCSSSGKVEKASRFVKPTVAIESFENRAPFPLRWDLGDGMADVLSAELTDSRRVKIVSRIDLNSVLDELELQQDPAFREQGRATPGQLRNAQYLVRGTVVDFTHTAGGGFHFMRGLMRGRTTGYVALVTIALSVIEVETREVYTATFEGRAWAASIEIGSEYSGVGFGGKAFFKKPLGKATREAINDAVGWLVEQVASSEWIPLIARIDGDLIYVNGGADRGLAPGEDLVVVEPGSPIIDPATGDVLGNTKERIAGRLRVVEIADRYAVAEILQGDYFRVGQRCRRFVP